MFMVTIIIYRLPTIEKQILLVLYKLTVFLGRKRWVYHKECWEAEITSFTAANQLGVMFVRTRWRHFNRCWGCYEYLKSVVRSCASRPCLAFSRSHFRGLSPSFRMCRKWHTKKHPSNCLFPSPTSGRLWSMSKRCDVLAQRRCNEVVSEASWAKTHIPRGSWHLLTLKRLRDHFGAAKFSSSIRRGRSIRHGQPNLPIWLFHRASTASIN